MSKNFDYNNKEIYQDAMDEFILIMEKLKFRVYLAGGTLLGACRNNDFIPSDDDIDLYYLSKQNNIKAVLSEFESIIQPCLIKKGYSINTVNWIVNGRSRTCLLQYHITKNDITLDIWGSWIDMDNKVYCSHCVAGIFNKSILLPFKSIKLSDKKYLVPNNYDRFLEIVYGKDWKIPSNFRPALHPYFIKKKILKLIDLYGWAYYFIAKAQQKFSIHQIDYVRLADFKIETRADYDIIYIPSPGLGNTKVNSIIQEYNKLHPRIKIIGAYAGENRYKYINADLLISISAKYLPTVKSLYPNKQVIFLPECTDVNFFTPKKSFNKSFIVGYAGRTDTVKRIHIMDQLKFPIKKKTDHSPEFLIKNRTLDPMKEFYHSLDCFILTSASECMPGVVLEAMACELPIISTDVGSMNLLIDKEWLIPPNPEELVIAEMNKKLTILKNNPLLRKKIGKKNREHIIKYFNWENNQLLWDEVFTALYYNDYNKIKELVEQYYSHFKILQDLDKIIPLPLEDKKVPIKEICNIKTKVCEVIKVLHQLNINFWLLENSCLEAVLKSDIITDKFYIGVSTIEQKQLIEKQLKKYLSFLVVIVDPHRKVKHWTLYNLVTQVPFPVIAYLEKNTGKSWMDIKNGL